MPALRHRLCKPKLPYQGHLSHRCSTDPRKTHSNDAFGSLGQAKVSRGMTFFPTVMHQTPQNMEQRHNNDTTTTGICRSQWVGKHFVVVSLLFFKRNTIYFLLKKSNDTTTQRQTASQPIVSDKSLSLLCRCCVFCGVLCCIGAHNAIPLNTLSCWAETKASLLCVLRGSVALLCLCK